MQIFNSFNELAAGQSPFRTVADMSTFNVVFGDGTGGLYRMTNKERIERNQQIAAQSAARRQMRQDMFAPSPVTDDVIVAGMRDIKELIERMEKQDNDGLENRLAKMVILKQRLDRIDPQDLNAALRLRELKQEVPSMFFTNNQQSE